MQSEVLDDFKSVQKTNDNVELSTWSFEDAMAFVGADEAVMA
jgi:hypothetical protein